MQVSYDGVYGYQNKQSNQMIRCLERIWTGYGGDLSVKRSKALAELPLLKTPLSGTREKMHKGLFAIQHPKIEKLCVNPCIR